VCETPQRRVFTFLITRLVTPTSRAKRAARRPPPRNSPRKRSFPPDFHSRRNKRTGEGEGEGEGRAEQRALDDPTGCNEKYLPRLDRENLSFPFSSPFSFWRRRRLALKIKSSRVSFRSSVARFEMNMTMMTTTTAGRTFLLLLSRPRFH